MKRKRRKPGWKEAASRDFDNTFSSVADDLYDQASKPRNEQVEIFLRIFNVLEI